MRLGNENKIRVPGRIAVQLVLASASPRRAELLRAAGIGFRVHPADVDETIHPGEPAEVYVRRIAAAKARVVVEQCAGEPVLAADTAVVVDGRILGKPADAADARRMLRLLSGRSHQVLTGVTLIVPFARAEDTRVAVTTVEFAPLSDEEIEWYVASSEGMDKAGAYAVQGLASRWVTRIDGSYANVVGLPVALVYVMCREAGILIS
ncbi:MAG TPA: Maf family protein [Vicinamibacterales bacterium]|nr:Maf family protein [Vicinamibacterales bacterium]